MLEHPTPRPAREPTEEEWAEAVDEATKAQEQLQVAVLGGRAAMWKMAEACWQCDDVRAWTRLGFETKGEWLAQPEVSLTRETFDRFVRVWDRLVIIHRVDASALKHLDVTKVDVVLRAVTKGGASVEDALGDAEALGWHDLRDKYQGLPSPADPPVPSTAPTDGSDRVSEPLDGSGDADLRAEELLEWIYGEAGAWAEVEAAINSGAPQPRLDRRVLLLLWQDNRARPEATVEGIQEASDD